MPLAITICSIWSRSAVNQVRPCYLSPRFISSLLDCLEVFISPHLFILLLVYFLYFLGRTSMRGASDKPLLPSCPPPPPPPTGIRLQEMNNPTTATFPHPPNPSQGYLPSSYLLICWLIYVLIDLINPRRFLLTEGSDNQWVWIYSSLICFDSAYRAAETTSFLSACPDLILMSIPWPIDVSPQKSVETPRLIGVSNLRWCSDCETLYGGSVFFSLCI